MCIRPCNRIRAARRLESLAALLLVLGAGNAAALSTDRNQPIDVTADYTKMVQGAGKGGGNTVLRGNVKVVQGTMKAAAAEATLFQDAKGGVQRVVLTGNQARIEQQQDGGGLVVADADRIDYDNVASVAVLTGNVVVVQQGRGEFRGPRMTYNTNTGEMEGGSAGGEGGGRVHIVVQPSKPAEASAAGKP